MTFKDIFGSEPTVVASAPGRVNLLGEHTDYNDGYVLPTAIPQKTTVSLRPNRGGEFVVHAADLASESRFQRDTLPGDHFASYVYGCIRGVMATGAEVPHLDVFVHSDVPMGVGLSSSAALEVAMLRALRELLSLDIDDVHIAQMAQRAEIDYAKVNCGIMDQMASSLADDTRMLFLDTRTLERRLVPMPEGTELLVVDSGLSRSLAGSAYNERRAECEAAARALGVPALRDVTEVAAVESLPEPQRRRARHVVTENARVLRAVDGVDAAEFGQLMNASHASLRDDYEVSVPELDRLVDLLQQHPFVHGARLTGAGFGGACVALCRAGEAARVGRKVVGQYNAAHRHGRVLVPQEAKA
ncbi:galactokinase [Lysobacter xinjiangensis]|uniref:Galactokinase n=1 Tax=Cognatilysobacter xinjiangensis TaxID=546892 RepID=A0ABQ3BW98_9GAMM|nr:galactokinase [Lysobacter xinjiangensis]GGZ59430.1 galactokinase [Lysobacter xinjiangensis]